MRTWSTEHRAGDVGEFHARPLGDQRSATFFEVRFPTLVLGSSQSAESVDIEAAGRHGVDIARRRSGGGGVLLWPGEHLWLDLEIPASDELWSDDVGRAMWWVGDLWQMALTPFVPETTVHRGRLQRTQWSSAVCFAGVGPGEVLVGGAKLVGVSQRRTRHAARFQTMVHGRWRPDVNAALVAGPPATRPATEDLAPLVATCTAPAETITSRLVEALNQL